jgi:hypothetical protein
MFEIALGGFHQVGNEIVSPLQLHIDLGERILEPVAQRNQTVVDPDGPEADDEDEQDQNSEHNYG